MRALVSRVFRCETTQIDVNYQSHSHTNCQRTPHASHHISPSTRMYRLDSVVPRNRVCIALDWHWNLTGMQKNRGFVRARLRMTVFPAGWSFCLWWKWRFVHPIWRWGECASGVFWVCAIRTYSKVMRSHDEARRSLCGFVCSTLLKVLPLVRNFYTHENTFTHSSLPLRPRVHCAKENIRKYVRYALYILGRVFAGTKPL